MDNISGNIFDKYVNSKQIFKRDREILRPSYIPDELPHRKDQIDQLASILVTALRGDRPSNVLIFGKTGTGKTASVKYLGKEILKADEFDRVIYLYMNCEVVDTQYGVLQNIGNMIIDKFEERIPFTGWSTERVYNILREKIDELNRVVIIVLDEIDKLVYKSSDDVLYNLSRINDDLERSKVSLIGISNDLKFTEFLDPRVRSRLGEEKMVFSPYNAEQLRDILDQRSKLAFYPDVIDPGVPPLCSALAAQEHGDARRALDLLRVAAEIAERNGDDKVTEAHVYKAKNKIELDCVTEAIKTLPTQSKLVLMSIIINEERGSGKLTTGELYETYRDISQFIDMQILTQRRVTDLVSELDMMGIVHARVKSFGRGGRTKEIDLSVPINETKKILEEDEVLHPLKNYRPKNQTTLI
ncbi:cell division control protein Cdc6 [Candidatus Methanomassiliicoccus intestinalis]|uniref:ORC1-type DNA replication protein n=1 Tax=Methanomassiliicoccus intestinalis (strain Issoire-Mx1) TaxID=1295009 RepID=R9T4F2_METII|nr:ORC1-type DNA replication protein [Candidatus Methanomassiliicoccus intestinalis]AGN25419.1 cell division control protein 6 Cdc6/Orc1 [Candidatus Methanomassiliicoccus intestinalis Issoire-Mx1]TQS81741.1 MAG: cell division control protein Cdc6 [Candidatus Methanomassiliicoccus intestinalis]